MSHYSPVVAALVTLLLTTLILAGKFGKEIQDIPNERSLHQTPVPRIGGVGLMAGTLSGWALTLASLTWWLVLPLIGLFAVSLLDDMHGLPVWQRLSAHPALRTASLRPCELNVNHEASILGSRTLYRRLGR